MGVCYARYGLGIPTMKAWSFSSLKAFKTCPKQYYHLRVAKDYKQDDNTEALMYGKDFHKSAEDYVRDGTPLPEKYNYAKPYLDTLRTIPGDIYCEHEMGLTKDLRPCTFHDPEAWHRGIADLIIINKATGMARVIDYKTGKSAKYADTGQLELVALCIFKHFPEVKRVKAGLLFTVANSFKKADYSSDKEHTYWRNWMGDVERLERAFQSGVWNPVKGPFCKAHCVVDVCIHNGRNK